MAEGAFERRIKNTTRLYWEGSREEEMPEREEFIQKVIIDLLKIEPPGILGIQRNGKDKYFDVTMKDSNLFQGFLEKSREKEGEHPLDNFRIQSLGRNNFRILTINMFDMNMEDEEVESFLRNHVRIISTARYRRDRFGVWNGQRQYQVLLNEDPAGFHGYHHPPASFKIAGVRGYIVYSGQPQYCRRCQEFGHLEYQCNIRCLNCKDPGHAASECPKPKACKECGATSLQDMPKMEKNVCQCSKRRRRRRP
ncbi:UNVERIFIED_CONTAM: hypothetical protein FKN15_063594 [Acipenser sinensis]